MVGPISGIPLTGATGPALRGALSSQPLSALGTQALSIVAGSAQRFDVKITGDYGPKAFVGPLEYAQIAFCVRDVNDKLWLQRACNSFLPAAGWFHCQLNEIDTTLPNGTYFWSLVAILPDGPEVDLTINNPLSITNDAHRFLDLSTIRPSSLVAPTPGAALSYAKSRIAAGSSVGVKPTRVMAVGDSIWSGGVPMGAAYGGIQWWYQHFCNLFGKAIQWVGNPGLGDASPTGNYPVQVDGLPWNIAAAAFNGASLFTQPTFGMIPFFDGSIVSSTLPFIQACTPDLIMSGLGTNDMKGPTPAHTAEVTLGWQQQLMAIWQAAINSNGKPCPIAVGTVPPPPTQLAIAIGSGTQWTPEYARYRDQLVAYLATLKPGPADKWSIITVDHWDRFVNFIGPWGEDMNGSIDYGYSAMDVTGLPPWEIPSAHPVDRPFNGPTSPVPTNPIPWGYNNPQLNPGGLQWAVTPGCYSETLHPNFNAGMRIMAENMFLATYDLLANKV